MPSSFEQLARVSRRSLDEYEDFAHRTLRENNTLTASSRRLIEASRDLLRDIAEQAEARARRCDRASQERESRDSRA